MPLRPLPLLAVVLLFAACTLAEAPPFAPTHVVIRAPADLIPLLQPAIAGLDPARIELMLPTTATKTDDAWVIAVAVGPQCAQCYQFFPQPGGGSVQGGQPLGVQYGLSHALELLGYRFAHPKRAFVPRELPKVVVPPTGLQTPAVAQRRGLHLHTIHPTDAMFDFWQPDPQHLANAKLAMEFVLHHRGNYLQWVALDNITDDAKAHASWRDHTRALTAYAHSRGLRVGLALQLFGQSNLQKGFDLIDSGGDQTAEMERRLRLVLDGNGFDTLNLSFGEFSGADPADFVAKVDQTYALIQKIQPKTEVTATIHVGNQPDLQVTYKGKTQLYYFLVQYTNPAIVPWVHTVMFYNLFEDAGGAYGHPEFTDHRAFLLDHLKGNQPVGYFPETAYWVAFDVCVPLYLPVYLKSRWTDVRTIAAKGPPLQDYVLFSSGWEWGYWQHDAYALRTAYTLPSDWAQPVRQWWMAWGGAGNQTADTIVKLAELQHQALIVDRLAPYLAGRDAFIDIGFKAGTVAQPDRVGYEAVLKMTAAERAAFAAKVVVPLVDLAAAMQALVVQTAGSAPQDPWLREVADGIQVTLLRVQFGQSLLQAVVAHGDGKPDIRDAAMVTADAALDAAKLVVARRHAALWDGPGPRLTERKDNATLYPYGYLQQADTLCFWQRERAQVRNLVLGESNVVPPCVL